MRGPENGSRVVATPVVVLSWRIFQPSMCRPIRNVRLRVCLRVCLPVVLGVSDAHLRRGAGHRHLGVRLQSTGLVRTFSSVVGPLPPSLLDAPVSSVQHDDCLALYWRHSERHVGSYVANILVSLSPAYIHMLHVFLILDSVRRVAASFAVVLLFSPLSC